MDFVEVIKKYPIPIGAGVIILLILMRGGSQAKASANTGYNPAIDLQMQSIAADTNVKISGQNTQSEIEGMKLQAAMAGVRASYASEMFNTATAASVEMKKSTDQSFVAQMTNFFTRLDNDQQMKNQLSLGSQSIDANRAVTLAGFDNQYRMLKEDSNRQLSIAGMQSDVSKYGIDSGRQIAMAQIGVQRQGQDYKFSLDNKTLDYSNMNLPSLLQHAENTQQIAANNTLQLAHLNAQNQQALATLNANVALTQIDANKSIANKNIDAGIFGKVVDGFTKALPFL